MEATETWTKLTNSLRSSCEMNAQPSGAFASLHPTIQEWIWQRSWTELRDAQEKAVPAILEEKRDVIISAATASGKTEAAFLPVASRLLELDRNGLALYISPLKALINDQHLRLSDLFGACELPVYPWHGDVPGTRKSAFEKDPRGALLITPESLESIFVRLGFHVPRLFRFLRFVIVDELHSFINTERGLQLASLLCRLEAAIGRQIPRIGLSATIGDMRIASGFLRPGDPAATDLIASTAAGQEIKLIIKGYEEHLVHPDGAEEEPQGLAVSRTAYDMFKAFRGSKNLVFANSRRRVEEFTDRLVSICESQSIPNEFYAHHGSLSKALREEVEALLKEPNRPATAVCTSTLEMGIDIGQVKSVAQIDAPGTVATLRQRLGRSGRRGEAAILRIFVTEPELHNTLPPQDSLRLDLFQSVAATELLLQKWCEPSRAARLHLSTLIQQVLSLIAQHGGVTAKDAWKLTCQTGPFRNIDPQMFATILRELAVHHIVMQAPDGTLLHGPVGEQIVNHYSFYTAFWASEEFKLLHGATMLGTLPVVHPVPEKGLILFGGRRWRVLKVDDRAKIIDVEPAHGGRAPQFGGGAGVVHPRVHQEMRRLYAGDDVPAYLDQRSREFLREGREQFERYALRHAPVIGFEDDSLVFLWAGDIVANTLVVHLRFLGLSTFSFGVGVQVTDIAPGALERRLRHETTCDPPDSVILADTVLNKIIDRYDRYLPAELLSMKHASAELDPESTWEVLRAIFLDQRADIA